jgi:hypothetical protein
VERYRLVHLFGNYSSYRESGITVDKVDERTLRGSPDDRLIGALLVAMKGFSKGDPEEACRRLDLLSRAIDRVIGMRIGVDDSTDAPHRYASTKLVDWERGARPGFSPEERRILTEATEGKGDPTWPALPLGGFAYDVRSDRFVPKTEYLGGWLDITARRLQGVVGAAQYVTSHPEEKLGRRRLWRAITNWVSTHGGSEKDDPLALTVVIAASDLFFEPLIPREMLGRLVRREDSGDGRVNPDCTTTRLQISTILAIDTENRLAAIGGMSRELNLTTVARDAERMDRATEGWTTWVRERALPYLAHTDPPHDGATTIDDYQVVTMAPTWYRASTQISALLVDEVPARYWAVNLLATEDQQGFSAASVVKEIGELVNLSSKLDPDTLATLQKQTVLAGLLLGLAGAVATRQRAARLVDDPTDAGLTPEELEGVFSAMEVKLVAQMMKMTAKYEDPSKLVATLRANEGALPGGEEAVELLRAVLDAPSPAEGGKVILEAFRAEPVKGLMAAAHLLVMSSQLINDRVKRKTTGTFRR